MGFNKEELKNLQSQHINQDYIDDFSNLFTEASIKLSNAIQTDEFDTWMHETLKDIIENGKMPYYGFRVKLQDDGISFSLAICSKYGHIFKEFEVRPDISIVSYTEQELLLTIEKWKQTGLRTVFTSFFEKIIQKLELVPGEVETFNDDNNGIYFITKILLD